MLHSVGGGNSPWNHKYFSLCLNEYNWTFIPMLCTNRLASGVPDDKDRHLWNFKSWPPMSPLETRSFFGVVRQRDLDFFPDCLEIQSNRWSNRICRWLIMDDWWLPVSTLSHYVSGWGSELLQRWREHKSHRYFAALYIIMNLFYFFIF